MVCPHCNSQQTPVVDTKLKFVQCSACLHWFLAGSPEPAPSDLFKCSTCFKMVTVLANAAGQCFFCANPKV